MLELGDPVEELPSNEPSSLIFDSSIYEKEVLLLPHGQTEDGLDDELATAARELGITPLHRSLASDHPDISTAISTLTVSSEHRSSISIRSHSTGFTSHPSRASKEQHLDPSSVGLTALPTRPSYDSVLECIRPKLSHSRSSSTASSTASNAFHLAARKFGIKRKRSHLPSIFRSSSRASKLRQDKAVTSSPRSQLSRQASGTSLECGHNLNRFSIRMQVKDATGSDEYLPPSCCGKPIPGSVLESVMSKAEMDELVRGLVQTYGLEAGEDLSPLHSPTGGIRSAPPGRVVSPEPSDLGLHSYRPLTEESIQLELAYSDPAYCALQQQQSEEMIRFLRFEYKQRKALLVHYENVRAAIRVQHARQREELRRKQEAAIEQLEESQVAAEFEMRDAHADEAQRVATALKYMERYCQQDSKPNTLPKTSNNSQSPEEEQPQQQSLPRHSVSDDDRIKLKRQYAIRDNLPHKHASAINVLRAKQEKELKSRQQRHVRELAELASESERQSSRVDSAHAKEVSRLERILDIRRRKLRARWELRIEMWRREYERGKGPLPNRLPPFELPRPIPLDAELDQCEWTGHSALDFLIAPPSKQRDTMVEVAPSTPEPLIEPVAA